MYERILIATDGSECSARAIREGVRIAKWNASLVTANLVTLLYVVDDATLGSDAAAPDAAERSRREANTAIHQGHRIAQQYGVTVTDHIVHGNPVVEIVREAKSFDLVVMGSHGKGLLKRMVVGSVTAGVLSHLHGPLLVVPPSEQPVSG